MHSLKFFLLAVLFLLVASCTLPSGPALVPTPMTPSAPPLPPQAPRPSQEALAAALNVPLDSIQVLNVQSALFAQACFEPVAQQLNCVEGEIVGYTVALRYADTVYEYRQSADGAYVNQIAQVTVPQYVGERARYELANQLNADPGQVVVNSVQPTTFPDTCLGVTGLERDCTPVETQGYTVKLEYGGQNYEYRANAAGDLLVQAKGSIPATGSENPIIEWTGRGENAQDLTCRGTAGNARQDN